MQKRIFKYSSFFISLFFSTTCFSQSVGINNEGLIADSTAILDINSTKKGLLIPRMTAQQKMTIIAPANGLLIYQTDGDPGFYYYNGSSWFLLINSSITDKLNSLIYTTKGF